eukprot:9223134-Lingulodinium_polyedra.AAC.1
MPAVLRFSGAGVLCGATNRGHAALPLQGRAAVCGAAGDVPRGAGARARRADGHQMRGANG